jgi:hypothetical protein
MHRLHPAWRGVWRSALAVAVLLALNVSICWRLFKVEYTDHFASIEGAFIGMARYISRHWGDFSWWPIWHCGMAYQNTYVPLMHLIVAATATVARISAARAYHSVAGVFYAFGAATLYLMAVRLGASRGAAFLGGLFYSLFSPSAVLMPLVARDIDGFWNGRRLQVLVAYGEGPHISSMTLIPIAILALENAVARRTPRAFALAALAIALVFLMNVPGTMALALAIFCWICAQPAGRRKAAWIVAAGAAALAYGVACYGIPPSSEATVAGNVGAMQSGFSNSLKYGPLPLAAVFAIVAAAGYGLTKLRVPLLLRFAALNFGLTAFLSITARPEEFELLPQVGRLHLEMEMGACLILGSLAWMLYTYCPRRLRPLLLVLSLAPVGVQWDHYRARARYDIQPADLEKRSEYTSARWLEGNAPGQRVYASGSTAFWLNAFTGLPQITGCCDQGQAMPVLNYVPYLVNVAEKPNDLQNAVLYLRALGVRNIVVNGAKSTDEYHDVVNPAKFAGVFPALHEERGDTIYTVSTGSLAHVLRPGEAVPAPSAFPAATPAVARYVAAIQDGGRAPASFQWLNGGAASIRANLKRDEAISVQVAWFRGWRAYVNGERRPVFADGLGFVLIHPECEGNCEITLRWTGPWDLWPSAMLSVLSLAAVAWMIKVNTGLSTIGGLRGVQ